MKSKNLLAFLVISIFAISSIYGCMAPTKTGEAVKPSQQKTEAQPTESKEIVEGVDQYEPNNSKEKATEIEVGKEIKGTIYRRGDKDVYKFTITSKTKNFSIEMVNPGGRVDPVMVVYEPDGGSNRVRPSRRGANLTAEMTAKSGDYYVEISDLKRGESSKPYVLKITLGEEKEEESEPSEGLDFTIE